jgi:hypothetical protein
LKSGYVLRFLQQVFCILVISARYVSLSGLNRLFVAGDFIHEPFGKESQPIVAD